MKNVSDELSILWNIKVFRSWSASVYSFYHFSAICAFQILHPSILFLWLRNLNFLKWYVRHYNSNFFIYFEENKLNVNEKINENVKMKMNWMLWKNNCTYRTPCNIVITWFITHWFSVARVFSEWLSGQLFVPGSRQGMKHRQGGGGVPPLPLGAHSVSSDDQLKGTIAPLPWQPAMRCQGMRACVCPRFRFHAIVQCACPVINLANLVASHIHVCVTLTFCFAHCVIRL